MPTPEQNRKSTARDFARISEFLSKIGRDGKIFEKKVAGIKVSQELDLAKLSTLTPSQQLVILLQETFFRSTHKNINKHTNKKTPLPLSRVVRRAKVKASSKKGRGVVTVIYDKTSVMPYAQLPFKVEYRDPNLSKPFNFHWGAARKWQRFGVVEVNVFGRKVAAGRMGTELEGFGWEPIGVKPRKRGRRRDYKFFIRVGYPGRTENITGRGPIYFPGYAVFLNQNRYYRDIDVDLVLTAEKFAVAWTKGIFKELQKPIK